MITWRDGKAGFVGAGKYLIKGFIGTRYTVTSAAAALVVSPNVISVNAGNRGIAIPSPDRSISINAQQGTIDIERE